MEKFEFPLSISKNIIKWSKHSNITSLHHLHSITYNFELYKELLFILQALF